MVFFRKNKFILILLAVVFILRLPSLFEPYWYGDEGIYLTIGMALRKGFLLYRDIYDNKPPLIYLMAGLANGYQFWFRLLADGFVLGAIYFFYQTATCFFDKQKNKVIISTLLFGFLTTIRATEGNIANAEQFILLPTMLGFWLFFNDRLLKQKPLLKSLFIGISLSLGFLFKAPALFDFATLMLFLVLFTGKKFISFGKKEVFLLLGYFFPIVFTGLFFLLKGAFADFFSASFIQMFGYLGSWQNGSHTFSLLGLLKSELALKVIFAGVICLFIWLKRKVIPQKFSFLLIWFVFSLLGATLSGRPYPHYLVQILPPFCLLLAESFSLKPKKLIFGTFLAVGLLVFSLVHYQFWWYPTLAYYQNFLNFGLGTKTKDQYFEFFNPKLPLLYQTGEFISANSQKNDKIFIWADEPCLYLLSRKLPSTPYLTAYHVKDLGLMAKAAQEIQKNDTKMVIVDQNTTYFPQLNQILKRDYLKIEQIGNLEIYRQMFLQP